MRPNQRRPTGYLLKFFAVAAFVAAFLGLGLLATSINDSVGESGRALFSLIFYAVMGATALVGFYLYRRGRQHTALLAEDVVSRDTRPPIVYLRSFTDEIAIGREEEALAAIFGEVGPFVAIGRPGDPLPPLGASRFYVAHSDWQRLVRDLLAKASLVLMLAGRTEGLAWEIAQCRRLLDPRRLIILVPLKEENYNGFRESFRSGASIVLPEHLEFWRSSYQTKMLCGAVTFDHQWRPEVRLFDSGLWRGYRLAYRMRGTGWRPKQARLWLLMHALGKRVGLPLREPGFNWALLYALVSLTFVATLIGLTLAGVITN